MGSIVRTSDTCRLTELIGMTPEILRAVVCCVCLSATFLGCGRGESPEPQNSAADNISKESSESHEPNSLSPSSIETTDTQSPFDVSVGLQPDPDKQATTPVSAPPASLPKVKLESPDDPPKAKVTTLIIHPVEDLIADIDYPVVSLLDKAKKAGMVESVKPCIVVRGLYPNMRQYAQILQSLRLSQLGTIPPDIWDFELERQQSVGSDKEWGKVPWAKVDFEIARAIMDHAGGWEDEPLQHVADNVITMPIPQRKNGEWGKLALHPRLTRKGFQQHEKMLLKGSKKPAKTSVELEEILKRIYTEKEKWLRERLGDDFDPLLKRMQGFNSRASLHMVEEEQQARQFKLPIEKPLRTGRPNFGSHHLMRAEYLLFRFIDFAVKPGFRYRYRVRLKLSNPFWSSTRPIKPRDRFLKTPWSIPTEPAHIPMAEL